MHKLKVADVLQIGALAAVNAIAFFFDGEFIRDAIFIDAVILGVNLRGSAPPA